jgi:hypothetical protein
MWVRAVCTAEYTDTEGTPKKVELTNWLTNLSDDQVSQLTARSALQKKAIAKHIIETEELAAEYAGVNAETLRKWVKNGMPMTDTGEYLKPWLDLYLQTSGNPTGQDRQDTLAKYPELSIARPATTTQGQSTTTGTQTSGAQAQPGSETPDMGPDFEKLDPEIQRVFEELMKEQP